MSDAGATELLPLLRGLETCSDKITAITHFQLIAAGFRCLGTGDSRTLAENEADNSFETLPPNWNGNKSIYSMRYIRDQTAYVLLAQVGVTSLFLCLHYGESIVVNTIFNLVELEQCDDFLRNVNAQLVRDINVPVPLPPPEYMKWCCLSRNQCCGVVAVSAVIAFAILVFVTK